MSVVGPNGHIPALATTLALISPVDSLMSWESIFCGTGQSKSGVGFDNNKDMTYNKELYGIYLTGDDQTNKDPADPVKKPTTHG